MIKQHHRISGDYMSKIQEAVLTSPAIHLRLPVEEALIKAIRNLASYLNENPNSRALAECLSAAEVIIRHPEFINSLCLSLSDRDL